MPHGPFLTNKNAVIQLYRLAKCFRCLPSQLIKQDLFDLSVDLHVGKIGIDDDNALQEKAIEDAKREARQNK